MKVIGRLRLIMTAAMVLCTGAIITFEAAAENYPSRPVRLVVGFPAGNAPDVVARVVAQSLSDRLGQQVVVDNRPGAASNIGAEIALKSPPDGYTLLMAVSTNAVNATLYGKLNFDFGRDIAPVASIARTTNVLVVHPSVPAGSLPEFIAYARAYPGKLTMATTGVSLVVGELFKTMAGVNMLPVPYRTSPFPDLLSGQVQVYFSPIPGAIGYIRAGTLRALAVTGAERWDALPNVPVAADFLPGYEANGWYGIVAPRDTPASVIDRLHAAINAVIADPGMKDRLVDLGATAFASSSDDFGKFIAAEIEKWGKVVKSTNLKPE
jgi:tripartite-type tricarboxylate transporter receptor subunit TctC